MSWLLGHAISPDVAKRAGVHGTLGGTINFLYEAPSGEKFYRERMPDGKMYQPKGQPNCLYWPLGRIQAGFVILCEGEGDTLAAASVIGADDTLFHCPVGMPGAGSTKQAAAELSAQRIRRAYLCLDGDTAGVRATNKLQELLPQVGVEPWPIWLPEDYDLADCLVQAKDRNKALRLLLAKAMHQPCPPPTRPPKLRDAWTQVTA